MKLQAILLAVSVSLASIAGCDALHSMHSDHTGQHGTAPTPPVTTFAPLSWVDAPTGAQLTAFLCTVLGSDAPLGSEASAACRARGPTPVPTSLRFQVRAEATIENRGMIRLPMESVLLVLTAYPDAGASQALGAVCLTLCDEGASQCPQTNEACRSRQEGVVELGDLEHPGGFVTSTAVEEQRVADLAVRALPPHGSTTVTYDLALDRERLLAAIQANDAAAIDAIRAGTAATFTIPYALEGTLWVDGRGNDGFPEPMARTTGTLEITTE